MANDKNLGLESSLRGKESDSEGGVGSRARNRTVMLTPEVTGQVRARLAQEAPINEGFGGGGPVSSSLGEVASASNQSEGFGMSHTDLRPSASLGQSPDRSGFQPVRSSRGPAGYEEPLAHVAPPPQQKRSTSGGGISWSKETMLIGFLVSFDGNPNGEFYDLRAGRIMVTSQGGDANSLVINDESVSPMHAVMRIGADGDIQVLDQLSEHGTKITRAGSDTEEQLSGEKSSVGHGDLITFGSRSFYVCLVQKRA